MGSLRLWRCLLLVYPPHFEEHAKNCTMYGAHKIDTIAHELCEEVVGEHVRMNKCL
jgi:hypothetical protein